MRRAGNIEQEMRAFADAVATRIARGQAVTIFPGCGTNPLPGFLNLDIAPMRASDDVWFDECEYFFFPFADLAWPAPDDSVDYIFHEDFIEHITQKQQVCFLAETLRVLKPGAWHRVNTPCLAQSMRRHSNFAAGMSGVHVGEWDNWRHVSLFTRHSLEEMARLVGYRDVAFNRKNAGLSPFQTREIRPDADRDEVFGNIFADLLK